MPSGCWPSIPTSGQLLRADPRGLALAAVEEALRYEPITPFTARILIDRGRVPRRHVPVGLDRAGVRLARQPRRRRGDRRIRPAAPSAPRARLLTFGAGIHYCVGANLARAEMQEALAFLAERVASVELDGEPGFGTPSGIYGLERLPLRLKLA